MCGLFRKYIFFAEFIKSFVIWN